MCCTLNTHVYSLALKQVQKTQKEKLMYKTFFISKYIQINMFNDSIRIFSVVLAILNNKKNVLLYLLLAILCHVFYFEKKLYEPQSKVRKYFIFL